MDLSKIPEPSEEEIEDVIWLVHHFCEGTTLSDTTKVIAHFLRHGSVLAEAMLDELPGLIQDVPIDDPAWGKVLAACRLFRKIGGAS